MSRWCRHYAGMIRDPKLVSVAITTGQTIERVVWVWSAILEDAAEKNNGGGYGVDYREIARFLCCLEDDILCILREFERILVADQQVIKWEKRNKGSLKDPTNAQRQARFREKNKQTKDAPPLVQASVTETLREVTPKRNTSAPLRNADKEREKEQESTSSLRSDVSALAERETTSGAKRQAAPKRGSRLPHDWTPRESEIVSARTAGFSEQAIDVEIRKFRNYFLSAPGGRGLKLDWDRTFDNWMLKAGSDLQQNAGRMNNGRARYPGKPNVSQMCRDAADAIEAREMASAVGRAPDGERSDESGWRPLIDVSKSSAGSWGLHEENGSSPPTVSAGRSTALHEPVWGCQKD